MSAPDARHYFRAIDVPGTSRPVPTWRFPGNGQAPGEGAATNAYLPKLHAAAHDATLAAVLVRVIGLKDRPQTLLQPGQVLRVLRGNRAGSRRPATGEASTFPAIYPLEDQR